MDLAYSEELQNISCIAASVESVKTSFH